jgi:fibronectin-binding autotransporter adhesin
MNNNNQHPKLNKILAIACLAVLSAASSHAATWNGGTMSYNTPGNWSGGQVPSTSVLGNAINDSGAANVVQVNPSDPDWVLGNQDILLGNGAGTSGSYVQNGPTVTLNYWFRMGLSAGAGGYADVQAGTLNVNGQLNISEAEGIPSIFESTNTGIVNVGGELWVGNNFNANGTLNLSGTSRLTVNNWFAIGRNSAIGEVNLSGNASLTKLGGGNITFAGIGAGTATLNQTGGAVTNETSETWLSENGTGFWNMTNGVASLGLLRFGAAGGNGTFNLVGGTLMVNQINMGNGSGVLNFNGGTLIARGSSANFMSGASAVIQAGGAYIDSQGFNITIASAIGDDGSGGSLTKNGSGELALTGVNTYLGSTVINAGKLLVNEASTPNGSYSVAGSGTLSTTPSTANAQFNAASLTLAAASSLDFDLGSFGNPTLAPLNVVGALTVNGAVTVNVADALPQLGQFPLLKYGSRSGSGSFIIGSLPIGVAATIATNVGGSIDLNITAVAAPRWDGQVDGAWDTVTTNWIELSTTQPAKYANGNAVLFNDSASGTTSVTLGVTVNPAKVTVNNTNLSYSISGSGKISGTASLVKQGTGSLALNNTNDYTGVTRIEGGSVSVTNLANGGQPSSIGSASSAANNLVLAGGTLSYAGPAIVVDRGYSVQGPNSTIEVQSDLGLSGPVSATSGSGFVKTGPAKLTYLGAGVKELSGGAGPGYRVEAGTVLFDGTGGAQTNHTQNDLWVGNTINQGADLILSNTVLNVDSWVAIGRGNGSSDYLSTAKLYNSRLRSGNFSMGYDNGIGGNVARQTLTLNGTSTITNGSDMNLGESVGSTATILLNDNSIIFSDWRIHLGWHDGGVGIMTLANSSVMDVDAWLSIGHEGGTGTLTVKDNSTLRVLWDMNVTDVGLGTGTMTIQDNAKVIWGSLFVGKGAGSVGLVNQTGGSVLGTDPREAHVGFHGQGTYNLSAGSMVAPSHWFVVGRYFDGPGEFNVTGGTFIHGTNDAGRLFRVGEEGTGVLNISGTGSCASSGNAVTLGNTAAGNGTINLNGGSLQARQLLGGPGSGTVNFNSGLLRVGANPNADFITGLTAANVLAGGAVIDTGTNSVGISQALLDGGGNGGLTKQGSGALYLNGANTYVGTTLVSAGSLGGNGSVAGNVTVQAAGTITAGDATGIGQLTIGGNLTLAGNVAVEVNTSLSPSNDVIAVTGTLTQTGAGTLKVTNLGPILQVGDSFTLFSKPVVGGASLTVSGGGAVWANNLAVDGSIKVVSLIPAPNFNPGSVASLPDGNKSVTGTGTIGSTYKLWASTNVALTPITTTWTLLSSGTVTTSPFTINDLTATNFTQRFYIFSAP